LVLEKTLFHHNRIAHHRHLFKLAQNIVSAAFELGGKVSSDERRVDGAGFQGAADNSHLAEGGDDQLVFIGIHSQLLEDQHGGHPAGAANAGDADAFAAQIFGFFDLWLDDQVVVGAHVRGSENFEISAACGSREDGRTAGETDSQGAGIDRRNQGRRAGHEDKIGVDAVLGEDFFILREPERQGRVADGGVTDGDFCRSYGSEGFTLSETSEHGDAQRKQRALEWQDLRHKSCSQSLN
jgi:hypothetical protein